MNTTRQLRISPANVMTGDLLVETEYMTHRSIQTVVTNVTRRGRNWQIETVLTAAVYAPQRRVTVLRSGPLGLGEGS